MVDMSCLGAPPWKALSSSPYTSALVPYEQLTSAAVLTVSSALESIDGLIGSHARPSQGCTLAKLFEPTHVLDQCHRNLVRWQVTEQHEAAAACELESLVVLPCPHLHSPLPSVLSLPPALSVEKCRGHAKHKPLLSRVSDGSPLPELRKVCSWKVSFCIKDGHWHLRFGGSLTSAALECCND